MDKSESAVKLLACEAMLELLQAVSMKPEEYTELIATLSEWFPLQTRPPRGCDRFETVSQVK